MGLIPKQWLVLVGIAVSLVVLPWSDQAFTQDTGQSGSAVDEAQQRERPASLQLSLKESIMLALENNLDVKVDKLNKDVRLTDIIFEMAKFDPTLGANFNHGQRAFPLNSTIDPITFQETEATPLSQVSVQDFGVDVQQHLQTGTDVRVGIDNTRTDLLFFDPKPGERIDAEYRSDLRLTIAQPLLRNFGIDINKTFINVARNNMAIEEHVFEDGLMQLVEDVTEAYWNLVLSIELLRVEHEALRAAQSLLDNNRARVEVGVLPSIEVLVAEADVASREEDVLVAAQSIEDREDELRRLLNLPNVPLVEKLTVTPMDAPKLTTKQISLKEALETAFMRRPDMQQRKRDLTNRGLQTSYAKNQLLPDLSFQGGAGLFGLGRDHGDNIDALGNTNSFHYEAGLVLSIPLGNRSAKSTYNKRRLEAETALLALKNLELDVTVEVKKALRDIKTGLKRIKVSQVATKLARRKAQEETERFKEGLSTSHDVLMFQRDLAQAQGREIRAIIDFNKSLVNAQRVLGTILEDADISMA
jgi:outer membrane protein TolC